MFCRDGLEDPVEDQGMVSQQLDQVRSAKIFIVIIVHYNIRIKPHILNGHICEMLLIKFSCDVFQLSTIGRCEYEKTCSLLVSLFDESASRYQEFISSGAQNSTIQIAVEQGTTVSLLQIMYFLSEERIHFPFMINLL